MPQAPGVADLLQALARILPAWCDGWYVFGAQAVQAWGLPRLSADVDITIRLRSQELAPFLAAMKAAGFASRVPDPEAFVRETRVLPLVHEASRDGRRIWRTCGGSFVRPHRSSTPRA